MTMTRIEAHAIADSLYFRLADAYELWWHLVVESYPHSAKESVYDPSWIGEDGTPLREAYDAYATLLRRWNACQDALREYRT